MSTQAASVSGCFHPRHVRVAVTTAMLQSLIAWPEGQPTSQEAGDSTKPITQRMLAENAKET